MTGKESSKGATDLEARVAGTVHGESERRALCVDLDGTLVATDTLWESLLVLVKKRPSVLLLLPLWLLRGRAFLKQQVALRAPLDPVGLPYRPDVLLFLKKERALGRRLILATGADESIARKVADHLGIFSAVLASDGKINLTGRRKVRALRDFLGDVGYDYAGNSVTDVQVWHEADRAILVDASERTLQKVARSTTIDAVFPARRIDLPVFLRAVRVHQWIKNLLVFVPLIVAHKVTDAHLIVQASLAFLALSLCASGAYIINDLLDLGAERAHPKNGLAPSRLACSESIRVCSSRRA